MKRIALGSMLHVAHVVTDGEHGWVTATDSDGILEVDLVAGTVLRSIALPDGIGPQGLRGTPDASKLIIAGWDGHSLVVVELATGAATPYDVGGIAVQAAVLPDGGTVELINLPAGSAGPVQLYPVPDSSGGWTTTLVEGTVDRVDVATGERLSTTPVGDGPNGITCFHPGGVMP